MSRHVFGWDLPPGCTAAEIDGPKEWSETCPNGHGQYTADADDWFCPECGADPEEDRWPQYMDAEEYNRFVGDEDVDDPAVTRWCEELAALYDSGGTFSHATDGTSHLLEARP